MLHGRARVTVCGGAVALAIAAGTIGTTAGLNTASADDSRRKAMAAEVAKLKEKAATDPRQTLFDTRMDIILDDSEIDAHLADAERNPTKFAGLAIGVDTRGHLTDGRKQAAADEAARTGPAR